MAARKPLFMGTEGFSEEMALTDSMSLGGLSLSGNLAMSGGATVTGVPNPTASGQVANKDYVDQQVIAGGSVKEALFSVDQLNNTDGINALEALYFAAQPIAGDTVIFKNATLTRTYTFVANQGAESAATDVSIESDAATAMQRLVTRAMADVGNTQWDLYYETGTHGDINDPIIDVVERASAAGDSDSRIYGVWGTQANAQVVEFAAGGTVDLDYTNRTPATLPAADPAEGRFGLRRQVVALTDGEIHMTLDTDNQYSWDNDATQWNQLSGPGSIPLATSASGGGVIGRVTFDSDKGLSVTTGIAEVRLATTAGLKFSAGALAVEPADFAGTGLEDDGADNLRLASQGNGIAGGAGSTLSVQADGTTGGNIQPVNVVANGVGLDVNAIAGTGLEADGSANLRIAAAAAGDGLTGGGGSALAVNLEASNPSLQIVTDELGVKMSDGLTKDANGLAVALDASGSALEFTGAAGDGTLGVKLEATNPTLQVDGSNQLGVKYGATTSGLETSAAGLKAKVDGTTVAINGSGQLYALGSAEAQRVENALTTATDAIAVGDPVYINGADTVGKGDASVDAKARIIGINRAGAGAAPQSIEVVSLGGAAGVLTSATPGTPYYLQAGGGIGTALPGAGARVIQVGFAVSTTDLWVRLVDFGKKAA